MLALTDASTSNLSELAAQVWNSGVLSRRERSCLQRLLLETTLTPEDRAAIDRLIHAVRRGWIALLD